jgi:hypothetical protein
MTGPTSRNRLIDDDPRRHWVRGRARGTSTSLTGTCRDRWAESRSARYNETITIGPRERVASTSASPQPSVGSPCISRELAGSLLCALEEGSLGTDKSDAAAVVEGKYFAVGGWGVAPMPSAAAASTVES